MKNIKLIAIPLASTIKYEIGKRYNFYSFKDLIVFSEKRSNLTPAFFDVNRYETLICGKIYIIKINYENNDFKILKEFNYERLKNSKDTELKLVYGIKFHDNYIIDEYKKTAMKNIILSKISTENELDNIYEKIKDDLDYSYFINLILQRNFENLTKKILENKLFLTQLRLVNGLKSTTLDNLIKKNVTNLNEEIIKYGYDKHIDYFKNKKEYSYEVLKRNRKQDYHLIKDLEPTEKRNLLFEGNEEHVKILEMEEKKDELFVKAIKLYKKNNSFFDYNKDFITLLKINENVVFIIEYFNKINNPLLLIHSKEYKNDKYIENDDFDDDDKYNAIHDFYHKWQDKMLESLTEKEYKEIKEDIMQLKKQFKFIDLFYYNYSKLEERIKWLAKETFNGGNK